MAQSSKKGTRVPMEGCLSVHTFTDQQGQ
ncbi:single-stranded DNA-binding protein [Leucobacter luti]|nr:single-stranded DNA-binding protein [Leucobacter luti]